MDSSWNDVLRRVANGEPLQDVLDEVEAADREDFRSYLADMGPRGAEALQRYDARMRDLDSGVTGARNAWHSISAAQRVALVTVGQTGGRIVRRSIKPSVYVLDGRTGLLCRIATVRNLCSHSLLAWDGSAFDPEQVAALTERGRFVLQYGEKRDA